MLMYGGNELSGMQLIAGMRQGLSTTYMSTSFTYISVEFYANISVSLQYNILYTCFLKSYLFYNDII